MQLRAHCTRLWMRLRASGHDHECSRRCHPCSRQLAHALSLQKLAASARCTYQESPMSTGGHMWKCALALQPHGWKGKKKKNHLVARYCFSCNHCMCTLCVMYNGKPAQAASLVAHSGTLNFVGAVMKQQRCNAFECAYPKIVNLAHLVQSGGQI